MPIDSSEIDKLNQVYYAQWMPYTNYLMGQVSSDLKINPDHLKFVGFKMFSKKLDQPIDYIINCMGAEKILSAIGDLRAQGINDSNNPTVITNEVSLNNSLGYLYYDAFFNDPETGEVNPQGMFSNFSAISDQLQAQYGYSSEWLNAFNDVFSELQKSPILPGGRTLYLYGNHKPDERIRRFVYMILERIRCGDAMPNALRVALLHIPLFGVANYSFRQEDWRKYNPKLDAADTLLDKSLLPMYVQMVSCFYGLIISQYQLYMPDEYNTWALSFGSDIVGKTASSKQLTGPLDLSKIPVTTSSGQVSSKKSSILPWAIGAALWASALIAKKRK